MASYLAVEDWHRSIETDGTTLIHIIRGAVKRHLGEKKEETEPKKST